MIFRKKNKRNMLPIQLELFHFVERALEHIPQHRWSKEDNPWIKHVKLLNMAQGLIDHDRVLNGQSVLIDFVERRKPLE